MVKEIVVGCVAFLSGILLFGFRMVAGAVLGTQPSDGYDSGLDYLDIWPLAISIVLVLVGIFMIVSGLKSKRK
ncbi:hypothetical protein CHM34_14705 [Paludifilum halophilum]|uniref:DUF5668 domain-containing protein n=1 Tax=Paludifilum halophilum TaxID=1642702 RepID=A0A235B3C6_9BACL|nr:hypothetical protein CHM34_14705 [Paludifilum halophilum]